MSFFSINSLIYFKKFNFLEKKNAYFTKKKADNFKKIIIIIIQVHVDLYSNLYCKFVMIYLD